MDIRSKHGKAPEEETGGKTGTEENIALEEEDEEEEAEEDVEEEEKTVTVTEAVKGKGLEEAHKAVTSNGGTYALAASFIAACTPS
jgi:hypothetical protein